jgi:hypothetical protein
MQVAEHGRAAGAAEAAGQLAARPGAKRRAAGPNLLEQGRVDRRLAILDRLL